MRPTSVHQSLNRSEKEKVMRKSFVATITLVAVLAAVTPVSAAPRNRDEPPSFSRIVKKFIKKVFGIGATGDPVIPIPDDPNP
jgi:hypothetical protein